MAMMTSPGMLLLRRMRQKMRRMQTQPTLLGQQAHQMPTVAQQRCGAAGSAAPVGAVLLSKNGSGTAEYGDDNDDDVSDIGSGSEDDDDGDEQGGEGGGRAGGGGRRAPLSPEERRRVRREKNRAAARRCRARKMHMLESLQGAVEGVTARYEAVKRQLADAQAAVRREAALANALAAELAAAGRLNPAAGCNQLPATLTQNLRALGFSGEEQLRTRLQQAGLGTGTAGAAAAAAGKAGSTGQQQQAAQGLAAAGAMSVKPGAGSRRQGGRHSPDAAAVPGTPAALPEGLPATHAAAAAAAAAAKQRPAAGKRAESPTAGSSRPGTSKAPLLASPFAAAAAAPEPGPTEEPVTPAAAAAARAAGRHNDNSSSRPRSRSGSRTSSKGGSGSRGKGAPGSPSRLGSALLHLLQQRQHRLLLHLHCRQPYTLLLLLLARLRRLGAAPSAALPSDRQGHPHQQPLPCLLHQAQCC
ncbi:hypothetical protein COO60DRAFT_192015 [Scenedesmus sp. NREL 46B-D3]|nr:hypothetical protein COO60DRAFT_192015 [Scenedesmus sp. NREL 46B-D3]